MRKMMRVALVSPKQYCSRFAKSRIAEKVKELCALFLPSLEKRVFAITPWVAIENENKPGKATWFSARKTRFLFRIWG